MFRIKYTAKFRRQAYKSSDEIKNALSKKEKILRNNPFDQRLKTHKLSGFLKNHWAFSVTYECRVIFTFDGEKLIILQTIGNHDIYKNILK